MIRKWVSVGATFLSGWCLGALMTINQGAAVAAAKYSANSISLKEYYRVCDENERIAEMYNAEHNRNAQLSGQHGSALRIVKKRPR